MPKEKREEELTMKTSDEQARLVRFSITVPEDLLNEFESGYYSENHGNRSEAIRNLMRGYVSNERWKSENQKIFATVSYTGACRKINGGTARLRRCYIMFDPRPYKSCDMPRMCHNERVFGRDSEIHNGIEKYTGH